MKETYTKPLCDVEIFKCVDVVTTSTGDNDVNFGE